MRGAGRREGGKEGNAETDVEEKEKEVGRKRRGSTLTLCALPPHRDSMLLPFTEAGSAVAAARAAAADCGDKAGSGG